MDLYELPMSAPLGPWREHALCAAMCRAGEARTEWWHPEKAKPGAQSVALNNQTAKAIAICNECPVMNECRQHAIENREKRGIWGGVGPKKRHRPAGSPRTIICRGCEQPFVYVKNGTAIYCSPACKNRAYRKRIA